MGHSPLETIFSLLTPLECAICKREGNMLCLSCKNHTYEEHISRCYLCNKITSQQRVCTSCRSRSRLRRVWWLGLYEGVTKELIHKMKFQRKRAYAREFGAFLSNTIPYVPPETIVMPAPTATSRVRQRGFDQALLIAESFARARRLRLDPQLYRATQVDQIGKNHQQRHQQMQDSLRLRSPARIRGKTVLLVDDVLTTGATLEAAAALLRHHDAVHVDAAVIARHLV